MAMTEQTRILFAVLTAAVVLLHLIYRRWNVHGGQKRANEEKAHLPPGSTGWPLIGETLSYCRSMASSHPTKFMEERRSRYNSDIFRSHLFGDKIIISTDPHFNKYAMQNEGRVFQSRLPNFLTTLLGEYAFFTAHGAFHRKLHGLTANMLRTDRIRDDFMDDIQSLIHSTMDRWAEMKEIVLQNEIAQMVLNLIAKQLLGLSPSKDTDEIRKLFVEFGHAFVAFPTKFPGSAFAKGLKVRKLLITKISKIIEERRSHPEVAHHDMLSRMMEQDFLSNENEIICDCILNLLFAGHETSLRAMLFCVKFLSDCPKALEQLRDEQDAILRSKGYDKKLNWDDYKSMKFTQCVINETLRIGNFTPGVFRETIEEIKVKDYIIPKGSLFFLFTITTHLNEKFYNKAFNFDPWRWQFDQDISNDPLFLPFGIGGRLCPGLHLARFEISIFLHIFLTKFRWEMLADDRISYFPMPHLTKGFPVRLHTRE